MYPSKEFNVYRVAVGERFQSEKHGKYIEMEVPFEEMDNAWKLAVCLYEQGHASYVTTTTRKAHHFFEMKKAVFAFHVKDDIEMLEGMIKMVFSYDYHFREYIGFGTT